ncbi:MAG: thiamine pyrophosphate-binding protein [Betaproteobacteria bacterium]
MTAGREWEERPAGDLPAVPQFGSDVIAATLRDLGIEYVALNPGASFRGLHDSLVNYLGNRAPQLLLCLHEEHAVAIAQGFAKVTGKPIAVAVHANVGLMHATMAIFNAWCDRMPVIVLGATGPVDAERRRPWIDWIHTARDQGALVRDYVKWDDQPASPAAAREALLRAAWIARTAPQAPVYVNFDAHLQEAPLDAPLPTIDAARYVPAVDAQASPAALRKAAGLLDNARRPLILMGRVSRSQQAWDARVALAEALQAQVVTDLKVGAAFPTDHPLHVDAPSVILSSASVSAKAIAAADVILALDWVDLAGTLKTACGGESAATIINVSLDHRLHNGWSMDHQGLAPVDVAIEATPDGVVPALAAMITRKGVRPAALARDTFVPMRDDAELTTDDIALALRDAVGARRFALAHLPLSWNGASWPLRGPLEFLGSDGGGGIGAGPGITVGAALALRGSGVLPLAVCGDGDFLMGATALWTAVHYRIPLLLVIANNRSFYNDEVHQERMARARKRPVANKWIGQRISDPDIDLAGIARAQGAAAIGPVADRASLAAAIAASLAAVDAGQVAVIDVRVKPGYTPSMAAGLTPGGNRA